LQKAPCKFLRPFLLVSFSFLSCFSAFMLSCLLDLGCSNISVSGCSWVSLYRAYRVLLYEAAPVYREQLTRTQQVFISAARCQVRDSAVRSVRQQSASGVTRTVNWGPRPFSLLSPSLFLSFTPPVVFFFSLLFSSPYK